MEVTETTAEGLKRELKVTIPAKELEDKLVDRLENMKGQIRLKGFRPGKVPTDYLRKLYGKSVMAEVVRDSVAETNHKVLTERNERPAAEPEIEFPKDEQEVNAVMAGKADLAYTLSFEVLPDIELVDFSTISVVRENAEPSEKDIEESLQRLADNHETFKAKEGPAEEGDRLTIDFTGTLEGEEEPFEGGSAEDAFVVIGKGRFIPGFEDGLRGAKAGDERVVTAVFPNDYGAKHLAGKTAEFKVKVKEVAAPAKTEINDEFAKTIGFETLDALKEAVKAQLMEDIKTVSRAKLKKALFDAIDKAHQNFELPQSLVESELDDIIEREKRKRSAAHRHDHGHDHDHDDDHDHEHHHGEMSQEEEQALREKRRALAERRVRVGLVLSEIGRKHEITLTNAEIEKAVRDYVSQFSGYEKQMYDYVQRTPEAQAEIRAPLFEDKVVDFLLALVKVEDKTVTQEELFKVPDEGEDEAA